MISIENVSKTYVKKAHIFARELSRIDALRNVSLEIPKGTIVGLVGESGCGKSTLARIMCGLEEADSGRVSIDENSKKGKAVNKRTPVQIVFQNPFRSLNPRMKVCDCISEGLEYRGIPFGERQRKVREWLNDVKLPNDYIEKYPHQLSGGESQRVALARSLAMEPEYLILDEPLSSLDVSTQATLLQLINEILTKSEKGILFISHDLAVVRYLTQYVYIMRNGEIVDQGDKDKIFLNPTNSYTRELLESAKL